MKQRFWFSLVITKTKLKLAGIIVAIIFSLLAGPKVVEFFQRQIYGVKQGVTLEGYLLAGLLERELYDAISELAEQRIVEARNAKWNWDNGTVEVEQVGMVVDIDATIKRILQAGPNTDHKFVTVPVLPSITKEHFKPYYNGPTIEPKVCIMINVDWGNEFIPSMLETLEQYDVVATWFPTGRWAKESPALARMIADHGHEIGNHGGWHGMPSQMSADEVRRLILEGEEAIMNATGQKPNIFAPPAGDFNSQTVAVAAELGYKTVLWTVDTIDWQRPAPTVIIDRVIGKVSNGALILMHPTQPTAEALPIIIEQLLNKGYQLVTVSEMLSD